MYQAHDSVKTHRPKGWAQWRQDVVPDEAVDGPLAAHFRARQIKALVRMLPLVTAGNAVNVMGISWVFWGRLPHLILALWCFAVVLSLPVAAVWWRSLIKSAPRPVASRGAARLIVVQVVCFAILWAVLPALVFPGADHAGSLLIAAVVVGTICGGAFLLSPMVPVAWAYVLTLSTASIVGLARSEVADNTTLLALLVVYAVIMCAVSYASGKVFVSRLRAEAETDRQKQLIDLLLRDFEEHASDWLWEVSPTGHLRHVSGRLSESFGLPPKQLLQQSFTELLSLMVPPDDEEAAEALGRLTTCLRMGQPFRDLEIPVEVAHDIHWWSLSAKPLFDDKGRAAGWRGVGSDITHTRQARDELARLANYDALTGLANRHRFSTELERLTSVCAAVSGPGQLQAHQRLARPQRGRPVAAPRGRAPQDHLGRR